MIQILQHTYMTLILFISVLQDPDPLHSCMIRMVLNPLAYLCDPDPLAW
jgi:hypothetical protein